MEGNRENIFLALLIVIIVLVAWQCMRPTYTNEGGSGDESMAAHPRAILDRQLDLRHGHRSDGHAQDHHLDNMSATDFVSTGAHLQPSDIRKAEAQSWHATGVEPVYGDSCGYIQGGGGYSSMDGGFDQGDAMTAAPYDVTNLVVDDRMASNHQKWANEMGPWSGTARKVDTLEVANYLPRTGIAAWSHRVPSQYNPLQLTEVDSHDLAAHQKNDGFAFTG